MLEVGTRAMGGLLRSAWRSDVVQDGTERICRPSAYRFERRWFSSRFNAGFPRAGGRTEMGKTGGSREGTACWELRFR